MNRSENNSGASLVEGIARVGAVEGAVAWLVPEQTTTCQGCASSSMCGTKGMGTAASRLEARRFRLDNSMGLVVGERAVVGIRENALVKASLTAYALPLATMLGAGIAAQALTGSDGITLASAVTGLAFGLVGARVGAGRLFVRGDLAPTFLRRAVAGETCHID